VAEVTVDVADDRFDVRYRPEMIGPFELLAAVRELGYEPLLVERPGTARAALPTRVDVDALPPGLRSVFAEANRAGRPLLLAFSSPG